MDYFYKLRESLNNTHRPYSSFVAYEPLTPDILFIRTDISYKQYADYAAYYDHVTDVIVSHIDHLPKHIIMGVGYEETNNTESLEMALKSADNVLSSLKQSNIIADYTVFANDNNGMKIKSLMSDYPNVIFFPWFMLKYYYLYLERQFTWNHAADKFLFLPGKINKAHRIYPMYKLWKDQMLDSVSYTFLSCPMWGISEHDWFSGLRDQLNDTTNQDFNVTDLKQLLRGLEKDQDGLVNLSRTEEDFKMQAVSEQLYNTACIELVSETWMDTYHLTEKTWRPIMAGQPFIHINPDQSRRIREMGFKTFENYTEIADAPPANPSSIKWIPLNCDVAIGRASQFVHSCKNNVSAIQQDLDYNRKHMMRIINKLLIMLDRKHPGVANCLGYLTTRDGA